MDSNHRPLGYEPSELPLLHAAFKNQDSHSAYGIRERSSPLEKRPRIGFNNTQAEQIYTPKRMGLSMGRTVHDHSQGGKYIRLKLR
jgi:hypothetical protein